MRAVVQRVTEASVTVAGEVVGAIGPGLLLLVGAGGGDDDSDAQALAAKVAGLRIFPDDAGRMNRSVIDHGGAALVISQFTLFGDVRRGRRPSFTSAAAPEVAEPLVEEFARLLTAAGIEVATGVFGAKMDVQLVNDGPVTILIETRDGRVV
jgi:D-tyrosyl-tRNA(Tyr) deacylase